MQTIYEASILLVDDNPDLLVLVGDSLRTAGYTCIRTAATCAEARALFAAAAPELMILDINLPDGDGFGLFRTLRTESDVPALFLSARCAALAGDCRRAGHRSRWRYDPAADRRLCGGAGRHGQPHE